MASKLDILRDELIKRDWQEVLKKDSALWDLKWSNSVDLSRVPVSSKQLFNHYVNNQEMGSKTGLIKNLRHLKEGNTRIWLA
jgi:hypothetical protein